MYDYISGKIVDLTPSFVVVDNHGIGWQINISLNTYAALENQSEVKIYVCQVIRDDAHILFGFAQKQERELFTMLTGVPGIGPNTARMILSSLSAVELQNAVLSEDINTIKRIKGIGLKTAQRLIIDLKDKLKKADFVNESGLMSNPAGQRREESVSALVMLGFLKPAAEKNVDAALASKPDMSTEDIIKFALRNA